MCEIFCFNSKIPKEINYYLECFYKHSDEHPHGWGLAVIHPDEFILTKEPVKATESSQLKEILCEPIVEKNVFAHIRLATVGELVSSNCHPFIQKDNNNRSWILMHNGTIFDFPELDKYTEKETGDTDSERILLHIIDEINEFEKIKKSPSTLKERFNLLTRIINRMSKNNKLNLMLHDGELTYIHTNTEESLYFMKSDESFLVVSTPLDNDENWVKLEINKLFALNDGEIIFESEPHDNKFILTEEHEKAIEEFLKTLEIT